MTEHPPDRLDAGFRLNDEHTIPCVGLGVFQSQPGSVTQQAVQWALEAGYRMIDTASMYQNEADVGAGVRASGLPRKDVFVTTKLWHSDHGYEASQKAFYASLRRLGLEYIDLYLIHWPRAPSPTVRLESWKGLVKLQNDGLCRSIGVSNYTVRHLQELLDASETVPAVNQVEFHPFVYDPRLLAFCTENGIRLEAWSPITRGKMFDHPVVAETATAHGRTPAQVMLRWGLQHGVVEIPKSIHRDRIVENSRVFDFSLTDSEMEAFDHLQGGPRVGAWNPADIP
ncbi:MAG: aldo/keto reductase [Thermoplasmata archaeon]|jgi:diketogulonate reductase-like aldo/keto reductase|nr:aldo/keto reductase [Thermoplasmata archaeon]